MDCPDDGFSHATPRGKPENAVLPELAEKLTNGLDHSAAPEEIAQLVEEYVRQGADLSAKGAPPENAACAIFNSGEHSNHVSVPEAHAALAERARAAGRIRSALCRDQSGKKPPAV